MRKFQYVRLGQDLIFIFKGAMSWTSKLTEKQHMHFENQLQKFLTKYIISKNEHQLTKNAHSNWWIVYLLRNYPASNCMFKVNNINTRTRCEICSKLTIKTRFWCRSGVFNVHFEHISHLALVFLLLTLSG